MTHTFTEHVLIDAPASSDSYQLQMQSSDDEMFLRFVERKASDYDVLVEQAPCAFAGDTGYEVYLWEWRDSDDNRLFAIDGAGGLYVHGEAYFHEDILMCGDTTTTAKLLFYYNDVRSATISGDSDSFNFTLNSGRVLEVSVGGISIFQVAEDRSSYSQFYGPLAIYQADLKLRTTGADYVRLDAEESAGDYADMLFIAGNDNTSEAERMRLTGNGRLGIGTDSPEQALHVYGSSMQPSSLMLDRVQNQAYGPRLTLRQSRGAGANGQDGDYLGHIQFRGYNDAGTPEEICFAEIVGRIGDASDGTEDGVMQFSTMKNGVLGTKLSVGSNYIAFTNVTEVLAWIDAGSASATEQDWIQVEVGGNTGYLRVYSSK